MSSPPPIRHELTVAAEPARAFEAFTDEISGWWPLAQMNVLGEGSLVSFTDDALVERTIDGSTANWGEVHEWDAGRLLRLSWHPGAEPVPHTELTVTFIPTEHGTRIQLEHAGWEVLSDPGTSQDDYAAAWPLVLAHYSAYVDPAAATAADPSAETWVALMHTPGPSAPSDAPVMADPRFADHVGFLQRMAERGYLVAAGPLDDADGSGMTILRIPGEDGFAAAVEFATLEDGAVASGLLSVTVRPWSVMFHTLD